MDECGAFLFAMDHNFDNNGGGYHSTNFNWFKQRYPRFIYIDRIAVATKDRGRGLAKTLYHDLFAEAIRQQHSMIVCEVNQHPPNPASVAFHIGLGFIGVGQTALAGQNKTVQYFMRNLTSGE
jgi:predicted GNAT superfamily acetyltransferase